MPVNQGNRVNKLDMMRERLPFRSSPEPTPGPSTCQGEAGRQALFFHTLRLHAIALAGKPGNHIRELESEYWRGRPMVRSAPSSRPLREKEENTLGGGGRRAGGERFETRPCAVFQPFQLDEKRFDGD
jgi:hypothetical protein